MLRYFARIMLVLMLPMVGCRAQSVAEGETAPADATSRAGTDTTTAAWQAPVPSPSAETRRLFDETMAWARTQHLADRPMGEAMQALGLHFAGAPYAAGMLDEPEHETLVCTLNRFDCVTFVETTLAMARGIESGDDSYDTFARHLRQQRYRGGRMDGYCSRLHYFSEWIDDNEARGIVRDVTREAGGVPFDKTIDFMTTHRDSYPRFAQDDSLYQCIAQMEARLAGRQHYYIPQDSLEAVYDRLEAGDVVAIATSIAGLDVSHTGLIFKSEDGSTGLLHASTSGGVKVSPDLQAYIQHNSAQTGIFVARPVAPQPR